MRLLVALAGLAVLASACAVVNEPRSWAFVQSVGGIVVDKPVRGDSGGWDLPIDADVSGLRTITTKPTLVNRGLACRTSAVVEGQSIFVTISTEPAGVVLGRPECPSVHIEGAPPGRYMVYYRGLPNEAPMKLYIVELKVNLK